MGAGLGLGLWLGALLAAGPVEASAPSPSPSSGPVSDSAARYHDRRTRLGLTGMATLTGWSVANIAGGLAGNFTTTAAIRYFHQGNWAWNTVNLALGISGLVGQSRERRSPVALGEGLARARKTQLVFAINAGLDVVYIAAGAISWQLADQGLRGVDERLEQRLVGYGQALVLQGGFLLLFDVGMLWAHELLMQRLDVPPGLARLRPSFAPRPGGFELGLGLRF